MESEQNPLLLKEGWREAPGWFLFFETTTPPRFARLPLLQKEGILCPY